MRKLGCLIVIAVVVVSVLAASIFVWRFSRFRQAQDRLMAAVQASDVAAIEEAIASGARVRGAWSHPDYPDARVEPIELAVVEGGAASVRTLMKLGARVDRDDDHMTTLAATGADVEVLGLLEAAGFRFRAGSLESWTRSPLFVAARYNESPGVLAFFVEHGFDVDQRSWGGDTPLFSGALSCRVDELIRLGADVSVVDRNGETALFNAILNDCFDAAQTLIDAGVDVNQQRTHGEHALVYEIQGGADADMIRLLLDAGSEVDLQDEFGRTALMRLGSTATIEVAEMLLAAGADPTHHDLDGVSVPRSLHHHNAPPGVVELVEAAIRRAIEHHNAAEVQ